MNRFTVTLICVVIATQAGCAADATSVNTADFTQLKLGMSKGEAREVLQNDGIVEFVFEADGHSYECRTVRPSRRDEYVYPEYFCLIFEDGRLVNVRRMKDVAPQTERPPHWDNYKGLRALATEPSPAPGNLEVDRARYIRSQKSRQYDIYAVVLFTPPGLVLLAEAYGNMDARREFDRRVESLQVGARYDDVRAALGDPANVYHDGEWRIEEFHSRTGLVHGMVSIGFRLNAMRWMVRGGVISRINKKERDLDYLFGSSTKSLLID